MCGRVVPAWRGVNAVEAHSAGTIPPAAAARIRRKTVTEAYGGFASQTGDAKAEPAATATADGRRSRSASRRRPALSRRRPTTVISMAVRVTAVFAFRPGDYVVAGPCH